MDIQSGLDVALIARQAQYAERSAELRAARQREEAQRSAVKYGAAVSQNDDTQGAQHVYPAATSDAPQARDDPQHLIDIVV